MRRGEIAKFRRSRPGMRGLRDHHELIDVAILAPQLLSELPKAADDNKYPGLIILAYPARLPVYDRA